MSLKSLAKKIFPSELLPYLQAPYRFSLALKQTIFRGKSAEKIISQAEKYLPYYQDKLSRDILQDRIEYLRTNDNNIFLRRAQKEGWKFPGIHDSKNREYSGVLVVYDWHNKELGYMKNFVSALNIKARYMPLREFLKNGRADDSELIFLLVADWHWHLSRNRVKNYLSAHNMHCNVDMCPMSIREEDQYFDVFAPSENEVIVDAGAYDGATALRFLKWGGDKIRHVYSFEFDPVNAAKCEEQLRQYGDKITVIRKGTWDKNEIIFANTIGGEGSSINSDGGTEVHLASIDSELEGVPVTFIKMDIEGAELKSLMGAKNTIIKNRPRLAICVYHKLQDIYEIPGYILSIVPEYKFYLRHYSLSSAETILYAYCK